MNRFDSDFKSRQEAHAYAARMREQGRTAKVYRRSGVTTIPFRGITAFTIYLVKVTE